MVRMAQLSREVDVDPGTELADHLPNVLRVLARLRTPSRARLARRFTQPALRKMCGRLEEKGARRPYVALMEAAVAVLDEFVSRLPTDEAGPDSFTSVPYHPDASAIPGGTPSRAPDLGPWVNREDSMSDKRRDRRR